jgi:hypothetical protein
MALTNAKLHLLNLRFVDGAVAARMEIVQNPGIAYCRVFCRTRFDSETAEHSAVNFHAV